MDSNGRENLDSKAEFRKPLNDSANRKYRRRSSVAGSSSSSDGSPPRDRNSSLVQLRKDITKFDDDDDERNRDNTRDRQSSRRYHRHDDHIRSDRRVDDYDRGYSKSSYHYRLGLRDKNNSNYSRSDKELPSRHCVKDVDTNSHGKSDGLGHRSRDKNSYDRAGFDNRHANIEKKDSDPDRDDRSDRYGRMDYRKSSMDYKGDRLPAYEESRDQINDYSSRRENSGRRLKESSSRYSKEVRCKCGSTREKTQHFPFDGSLKILSRSPGLHKVQDSRDTKEDSGVCPTRVKKLSLRRRGFSMESTATGPDGMFPFSTVVPSEKAYVTDSDIDAVKIAAMKAVELAEVEVQREFFNMISHEMGVKGDPKVESKLYDPDVEKEREQLQVELERQYTAGLRRRDGRTVGLGEAKIADFGCAKLADDVAAVIGGTPLYMSPEVVRGEDNKMKS
ncbi:hypothetical protein STAS_29317 [Striga asiatica]|uniref:Protein kinase superfamily protein n=1 Tax=Striga asiatica TaxID=4170 RepID=A0A5A7R598_STRAF|nr:hypothetical protein STAS_29317 [Striga asiatica]